MSGLLQRLAARALGQAPAVRPIVGWSAPPVQAGIVFAEANAVAAPAAASRVADEPPTPLAALLRSGARAPAESFPNVPSPLTLPPAPAPRPEPEAAEKSSPAAAAPAPKRERTTPVDRYEPLFPVTPSSSPASPASPPRAAGRSTTRDAPAPAPAREEPTEVHVSIGRIELTAVHEAPRPRREVTRARKPQSLEEYLKRREAERR